MDLSSETIPKQHAISTLSNQKQDQATPTHNVPDIRMWFLAYICRIYVQPHNCVMCVVLRNFAYVVIPHVCSCMR